ncbi:putative UPF0676 protein [Venturia nashicola]|uniref:Putative UPF0676 protein n=1 Tax=Venturia nashicola TaxID=86259 RepID=A0A4Z1NKW5_9PEZI|nr:putative UPF0676 protein [Venturia nashicola]
MYTVDRRRIHGCDDMERVVIGNEAYAFPAIPRIENESLHVSELVTLDLEDYPRSGGKERLAAQLSHAVHHVGFFYVMNYGLSEEQANNQFTLAKHFFELPFEEKAKYEVNYAEADYNGWRRAGRGRAGMEPDAIKIFNIPKFTRDFEGKCTYPDLLKAHWDGIEMFSKALHTNVVLPLLRLFAIMLQLPDEEFLVRQYSYEKKSEDHFRYMIYHKRSKEENANNEFGRIGGFKDRKYA